MVLESGGLVIEGHTGKSIIIEQYEEDKTDKKGEGLSSLSTISGNVILTTRNHRCPGDDCNGKDDRKKD
ncbi:MAG: hypothetical protein WAT46_17990 [Saprospiraceae bacterium]